MKNLKKLVVLAAIIPAAFASASAFAHGGGKGGKGSDYFNGKCSFMNERGLFKELDLTDEQEDQLRDMREAKREQSKASRADKMQSMISDMEAVQGQLQDLVLAKDFDEQKAQELAKAMVEKQSERQVAKLKQQHEMMSILTDAQKEQLKTLQAEKMADCSERMNERMAKMKEKMADNS